MSRNKGSSYLIKKVAKPRLKQLEVSLLIYLEANGLDSTKQIVVRLSSSFEDIKGDKE